MAHQSEIKAGDLDHLLPKGLAQSKEFRQDLNMSNAYWFYNPARTLLIQKKGDKEDAKEDAIRGGYRSLGATACSALRAKKLSDVELLVTKKVSDSNMLGIFANSVHLSNYEHTLKRQTRDEDEEEKKDEGDEDEDTRGKRINKKVD